jgi:PHD/YefM family antitoxin component YafN of YafNO toxin-antitoxin module
MFLQEFNSTQFQRNADKVFSAAYKKPIQINRQGKQGVVMMSKAEYAKLVKAANQ